MHVHIPTLSSAYTRVGAAAGRPHSNRERADEPPPPPPVPPLVPSSAMAAAEAAQCRFCFEGESETDADADGTGAGPLVAPCRCAGSLKHVHLRQGPTLSPLVQIRGGCGSCGSCGGCGFVTSRHVFVSPPGASCVAVPLVAPCRYASATSMCTCGDVQCRHPMCSCMVAMVAVVAVDCHSSHLSHNLSRLFFKGTSEMLFALVVIG
jgi:hypothetical protein